MPQDYAEAVKWWRKAAEQGHVKTQYQLGEMYHKGEGLPQDYEEAAKWWRKAADQGHALAQIRLGGMYYLGVVAPKNFIESYAWFLLAKANGIKEVSEMISNYEKVFTLEQMEKGQARALELHRLIKQKSAE